MVLLILILYLLLASTFTLAKAALVYVDPLFFIAARMIFAGSVLLGFMYVRRRDQCAIAQKDGWLFIQIGLFHIYGAYVFEFLGLPYINSAKACLLYNLVPLLTVFFAYRIMADRMTVKKWIGLMIGLLGFIPVLLSGNSTASLNSFISFSWPEFSIILSVLCTARGWIIMQKLVKYEGYSPLLVNGIGMLLGGMLAGISSLLLEGLPWDRIHAVQSPFLLDQWLQIYLISPCLMVLFYGLILIVIANLICYNLYGYLLNYYSATFISFVGLLSPLFAAFYGWLLLSEQLAGAFWLSLCIVSLGLIIFYQDELIEGNRVKNYRGP